MLFGMDLLLAEAKRRKKGGLSGASAPSGGWRQTIVQRLTPFSWEGQSKKVFPDKPVPSDCVLRQSILLFGFLTYEGLQEECNPFHYSQAGPQEAGRLKIAWHTLQEILSIRELEGIAGALPVDWRTTNSGSTAISGTNSPLPSIRANNVRAASSPIFWSG